jgi:hypothetical protein
MTCPQPAPPLPPPMHGYTTWGSLQAVEYCMVVVRRRIRESQERGLSAGYEQIVLRDLENLKNRLQAEHEDLLAPLEEVVQ